MRHNVKPRKQRREIRIMIASIKNLIWRGSWHYQVRHPRTQQLVPRKAGVCALNPFCYRSLAGAAQAVARGEYTDSVEELLI